MNKQNTALIIISMFLAACNNQPTNEELQQAATTLTDNELCVQLIVKPGLQSITEAELKKRNATCDPQQTQLMVQAYLAEHQQKEQLRAAAIRTLLQQPAPQATYTPIAPAVHSDPAPTSRMQTNCVAYRVGDQVHTRCQ